jgi:nucleotide sugar dehydrogenase
MTSRPASALDIPPPLVGEFLRRGDIQIAVLGLGRIGLPTAAVFADAGAKVFGVDINSSVVDLVNSGRSKFVDEPKLDEIIARVVSNGRLKATTDASLSVSFADFSIICVPTPVDSTKTPDYSSVLATARTVGRLLKRGSILIVESTVGPGFVEETLKPELESASGYRAGIDFGLASCPERSDPGNIVENMKTVPRIVGAIDDKCAEVVCELYRAVLGVKVVKVTNPKTANAVKLTENLFRDVNIALANEFALLFEKLGIDTIEVINACATKYNFMPHYPGAGVGGPCLPSNSYYLIVEGLKAGNIPYLIRLAREINDRMPDHVVELVSESLNEVGKTIRGSKIAVLGVSYKPGIKDVQLSPMERVCKKLAEMGGSVAIYDPMFIGEEVFGFKVKEKLEFALGGADCVLVGTAHREFRELDLGMVAQLVHAKAALVDSRGVVDPSKAGKLGFAYKGVGRKINHTNQEPKEPGENALIKELTRRVPRLNEERKS